MSDSQSRLSPDQIRFLNAPIWGPALRQDPKAAKGNVYIPGNFVLAQLNTAFCFDGWSFEATRVERVHMEKYQKDGKDQFRALYMVEGVLTVRCQDGTTFSRSGIGTDEKTSSNMKDVVSLATKAALTDAIKNAAITLGRQFGLDTVRAGNDASGVKVNWKANASGERPRPPMFSGVSSQIDGDMDDEDGEMIEENGVRFNSRTGVVDEGHGRQEQQREPEQRRQEPAPSQSSSQTSQQRQDPRGEPEQQRREPAQQQTTQGPSQSSSTASQQGGGSGGSGGSGGNGGNGGGGGGAGGAGGAGPDRQTLVVACREAFRAAGPAKAQAVFQQVAQQHRYEGAMTMIGRAPDAGGPSIAFLEQYLGTLRGN
jgi:uncharacterized membrane protein YgcG